jgi:hypothetical protein
MRIGQAYPSKYLKACDLPDGKMVGVTIDHVQIENVAGNDNPDDEKPVLYFVGKGKGMVLNKTNANTITAGYGDETEDWHGKPVLLFSAEVAFQGKMVPSIRVKVDKSGGRVAQNGGARDRDAAPQRQQAKVAAGGETGPFDEPAPDFKEDDIPF